MVDYRSLVYREMGIEIDGASGVSARSWSVLFVVTLSMCLEFGIIKGFSVLLPDLKEQLSSPTWLVGSAIGIIHAWGYVLGKYNLQSNFSNGYNFN